MTTVPELGILIADDIQVLGHYQAPAGRVSEYSVCVITAPAWPFFDRTMQTELTAAIYAKVGIHAEQEVEMIDDLPTDYLSVKPLTDWNDSTPTSEVLATLRSL